MSSSSRYQEYTSRHRRSLAEHHLRVGKSDWNHQKEANEPMQTWQDKLMRTKKIESERTGQSWEVKRGSDLHLWAWF